MYGTRSETHKILKSSIVARKVQMERARKRRREGHDPKKPTSTLLLVGSSETESNDIFAYVSKRRKEGEEKTNQRKFRSLQINHM